MSNSHSGLIVHKLIIVWDLPHPDNHECGNVLACAHGGICGEIWSVYYYKYCIREHNSLMVYCVVKGWVCDSDLWVT